MKGVIFTLLFFGLTMYANASDVLITDNAKKSYREVYSNAGKNKAFAQAPNGSWSWSLDKITLEAAEQQALERCSKFLEAGDKPCVIINKNGQWVQ